MRGVSNFALWLAAGLLACTAQTRAAESAAPPATVAQSPLVTLAAASTPQGLSLQLRRAADGAPLVVTDLTVSIDGRTATAARAADGSWSVAWPRGTGQHAARLEITVSHDGIRELLSGTLPAPATAAAPASTGAARLWRIHKQMAWWILNVAVVLIAAIAISRRMS